MNLYHLHLNARDLGVSRAFYETYFGFRRHFPEASELFLANDSGFLLALGQLTETETLSFPEWFHIGFQGESAEAVRALFDRMERDAVRIAEPWTESLSGAVKFHCFDPSGYRIEVRWDPVR
ncbi:MAG: VOC family protein [Polyangiaceae bacterium]|jgi:lactoylglutathione lyase